MTRRRSTELARNMPERQASIRPYCCSTMTKAAAQRKLNVTVAVTSDATAIARSRKMTSQT
jgi:hypothetical protein